MRRVDKGALGAGIVYLVIGVAFVLEALDVWTVRIDDLRYLFPAALVAVGVTVIIGTMKRGDRQS
jgi:hypothetical protein